ncbi:MAG TPA: response regulator [Chroococcidiopsis sp.]
MMTQIPLLEKDPIVLVIDDETDNFEVIEALLDGEGYQLTYLSDGRQALGILESFQPDVILLDVMMPQMNGIEFCLRFKSNPKWRHIPIIMVTALTAKEDLSQCLLAGADDFISKPVNGMELRSRVRSMLRIKQQYDALQETLYLREDLSRMIVHDLRNPLTSILLAAGILQKADYTPTRQQQKTEQIFIAAQQLQSMIDTLLLMAKLESGKMMIQPDELDLSQACQSAVSGMAAIAAQKRLDIRCQVPETGCPVLADSSLIRRVLDNLLSNAIKFSPSKSEITITAAPLDDAHIQVKVADLGPGVPPPLQQQIFEKYEIGALIKNTSQVGLGLAFCKLAIEAHGGAIAVVNNDPTGAVFSFTLPTPEPPNHSRELELVP